MSLFATALPEFH